MPKGPNGQKRPACGVSASVLVARIATGEVEDTRSSGRRNSGLAGAKARAAALSAAERSKIAKAAADARWKVKEMQMSFEKRFEAAFEAGLTDIKFFVRRGESAVTVENLKKDALAFQEAIDTNNVTQVASVD